MPELYGPPRITETWRFCTRQEGVERTLLEQRVSPGQQHAVEIGRLDEAQAGVGFVDADADGADHAGAAQFVERLEARVDHRLEALVEDRAILDGPEIDVVDQHDVDARDAEPEMRMFQRAHHAVVAVVEFRHEAGQAVVAEVGRRFLAGLRHAGYGRSWSTARSRRAASRSARMRTSAVERRGGQRTPAP
jgi:hypothetical protein